MIGKGLAFGNFSPVTWSSQAREAQALEGIGFDAALDALDEKCKLGIPRKPSHAEWRSGSPHYEITKPGACQGLYAWVVVKCKRLPTKSDFVAVATQRHDTFKLKGTWKPWQWKEDKPENNMWAFINADESDPGCVICLFEKFEPDDSKKQR